MGSLGVSKIRGFQRCRQTFKQRQRNEEGRIRERYENQTNREGPLIVLPTQSIRAVLKIQHKLLTAQIFFYQFPSKRRTSNSHWRSHWVGRGMQGVLFSATQAKRVSPPSQQVLICLSLPEWVCQVAGTWPFRGFVSQTTGAHFSKTSTSFLFDNVCFQQHLLLQQQIQWNKNLLNTYYLADPLLGIQR